MDLRLLKGLAIYGANAAGKSNVLNALYFLKNLVEDSATELDEGDPTGTEPFALDPAMRDEPSEFVLRFALGGVRYHFLLVLDRRRILFESLSAFPKGREQVWYERTWDDESQNHTWAPARPTDYRRDPARVSVTRENALYLSTAVKFNDEQLRPIYLWFKEKVRFLPLDAHAPMLSPGFTVKRLADNAMDRERILRLLQHADLGVLSARARERDLTRGDLPGDLPEAVVERIIKSNKHLEISLGHRGHAGREFPLPWEEESAGTQRLFALAGPWLDILKNGYFVGLDEIESSMHPAIVCELLKLFFSEETNHHGAQLVFTTHNPLLLDTEVMRRDQVWFADKDDEGATHLYPLTDYKPRNKESLVRGYMAGRYGAIPFIPHGLLNEPEHSSRSKNLDTEFLAKTLKGASKYLRIAGYFRSSIFELIGEEIAQIPEVKIVCNSVLDLKDFQVATGRETALKERWNQVDVGAEAVLQQERYAQLDALLKAGNVEIRVVPRERLFLHGKAGAVHYPDGRKVAFVGSVNETRRAFAHNYELIWEDDDEAAAAWVEAEFKALWKDGVPLPDAILKEIERVANRREVTVEVLAPQAVAAAALAEAPIYRGGEQLQPWQRSFVTLFLEHRDTYGSARLLLADEVGVGKTLSMAASALVSTLLGDGPSLILAPSTLTAQWQIELMDKLGIPSALWSSQAKVWLGPEGQQLSPKGKPETIRHCPYQIAIVSTGLITHQRDGANFIKEAAALLQRRFGCVILDEAHKARVSGGIGSDDRQPNNLLAFMTAIARKTRHLILGTATPIQTDVGELWELMKVLGTGSDFVPGDALSPWREMDQALPLITGKHKPQQATEAWQWLRNPLPPANEDLLFQNLRDGLGIPPDQHGSACRFEDLDYLLQQVHLPEALVDGFFQRQNPLLRHVVLRKRSELEDAGLLEKVGVKTHPLREQLGMYENRFVTLGIHTNRPFEVAYEQAEEFSRLLQKRTKSGGFMKSLMLQRICFSFASGRGTAEKMLARALPDDTRDQDRLQEEKEHLLSGMSAAETACLREIVTQLSRKEAVDSKLETVRWFLTEFRTDGQTWLEHGCIIFSQYFDTTQWFAKELSTALPDEVVAIYAGAGKSGLFRNGQFSTVGRETIKAAVKNRELRLLVATDAACEGLNLQTLGTLINVDLPWNPSRLEQRLGRIKRFGQARKFVDMLNLVYADTQDEKVYNVLSERLRDTYDIFGSLPETIQDEWIEDEQTLREKMDGYIHERVKAQNAFSVKYRSSVDPDARKWEYCAQVLSRRDVSERLATPWK